MGQGQHGLVGVELGAIHGLPQLQTLPAAAAARGIAGEQGAGLIAPAGAHHQWHAVVAGDLHSARMQHGRAQAGQLEHLVAGDRVHQLGIGHLARIGGEHPGHIGVDLTGIGPKGCSQGHR